MTKDEKVAEVAALEDRFSRASVAVVATNRGLTVDQATKLRRSIRAVGGEYKVAKHTLVRRAVGSSRYVGIVPFLKGPRSLVFGYSDPVALAKALVEFAEQTDKLEISGGAVEGQVLQAGDVKVLASMPPIDVVRAQAVRQALAPGRRVAASIAAPARRVAGAVAALAERLETGGSAAESA